MRHWPSRARSEAGFTGLFRTAMFSSRAAARTCGLRSAVIRIAGRVSPKRRRVSRREGGGVAADPAHAVAAVEMVVDEQAGDAAAHSIDRLDSGLGIGHR